MLSDKVKDWLKDCSQKGLMYYHPYRIDDTLMMFESNRLGLIAYPDENKKLIFQNVNIWNGGFSILDNIDVGTELENRFYQYIRENTNSKINTYQGSSMDYYLPWKTLPDKLNIWNQLDEYSQKLLREEYKKECTTYQLALEKYFGKDNLVPPPQINNWKDVLKIKPELDKKLNDYIASIDDLLIRDSEYLISQFKIIHIINNGYGGIITKQEWKDSKEIKWRIVVNSMTALPVISSTVHDTGELLTFRSKDLAERFRNNNIDLIKEFLKR